MNRPIDLPTWKNGRSQSKRSGNPNKYKVITDQMGVSPSLTNIISSRDFSLNGDCQFANMS